MIVVALCRLLLAAPLPTQASADAALVRLHQAVQSDDLKWAQEVIHPRQLLTQPNPTYYRRLFEAIHTTGSPFSGDSSFEPSEFHWSVGPDYRRATSIASPHLSIVLYQKDETVQIDEIAVSPCLSCDEPSRYVLELFHPFQAHRPQPNRLLPFIDLSLESELKKHPRSRYNHWTSLYALRQQKSLHVSKLFSGATVEHSDQSGVSVIYSDGSRDLFPLVYANSRWQIDYQRLPQSSPIRLSADEQEQWRSPLSTSQKLLNEWSPPFVPNASGSATLIGVDISSAHFNPLDGTVYALSFSQDRLKSGLFHIDPSAQRLLSRWALPRAGSTPLPTEGWFMRWPSAIDPTGQHLAFTRPNRVWSINLNTHKIHLVARADAIDSLQWVQTAHADPLLIGLFADGRVQTLPGPTRWIGSPALAVKQDGAHLLVARRDGLLQTLNPDHAPLLNESTCCGSASDAQFHPLKSEVLFTCAPGCGTFSQVDWLSKTRRRQEGEGRYSKGGSWSPDGRYFTTPSPTGLLLWDAQSLIPLARFATDSTFWVRWSAQSDQLLTVDRTGDLWLWSVEQLLIRHRIN